jgi:hypothetical protein
VFFTALAQSIRSLLITFIPAAIITFLAWAIAGSAYASTTDPFRGAAWITLGAHAIPFDLSIPPSASAGWLTYLPLGAMILPAYGIVAGARKTLERSGTQSSVWLFSALYVINLLLLGLASSNKDIKVSWYWTLIFALPFVLLVSYLATNQFRFSAPIIYLLKSWAVLLGFSAVLLGISLIVNFKTVQQLTTVIQPGFIGGILLLALTLLYLPNFFIATLAYISGTGFAIGRDTLISPFTFELGKIPALPILGALPTGRHPLYIFGGVVVIMVGAWIAYQTIESNVLILRQTVMLFAISAFLVAYLGSGALITHELGTIGPSLWKFPLILIGEFLLGIGLITLVPIIGGFLRNLISNASNRS